MWAGQLPSHMGKVALRMTAMQRAQVIRKGVLTSHLADPSGPPVHCLSCWRGELKRSFPLPEDHRWGSWSSCTAESTRKQPALPSFCTLAGAVFSLCSALPFPSLFGTQHLAALPISPVKAPLPPLSDHLVYISFVEYIVLCFLFFIFA